MAGVNKYGEVLGFNCMSRMRPACDSTRAGLARTAQTPTPAFSLALSIASMLTLALTLALFSFGSARASAQVNVTTYHNDIGRTGQNLNETILTPSNVNTTQFGKLFAQAVDGQVYAQPLYMSGITINGAVHNVIFIATENDTLYAFDADTNTGPNASPLWKISMLSAAHGAAAGATTIPNTELGADINPQVGITGTPVIDPNTNTLYVVSADLENGGSSQRVHAIDITTGNEKFGGPTLITGSVPGIGTGSVNSTLTFDSYWQNQRGGLLLLNGILWIGFGSHGDNGPWHGWVMGYNATTLKQTGILCTSPNGTGGGVWGAGDGLPADQLDPVNHPFGRMFIPTGNGDYTATKPYTNNMDYGDSHLALDLTNGVPTVIDEFTTTLQAKLDAGDLDQGSGGLMVIPTQTSGPYPDLAVQAGKEGTLFLLNRDNMGGYSTTSDTPGAVQAQTYIVGNVGVWATPAYWNGNVYVWGQFDYLKQFKLSNSLLSTAPLTSGEQYGYPGATPAISAYGNSNGIVWSVNSNAYPTAGPAVLQAHNASNVSTTLYSSSTNSSRDTAGPANKFVVPTVVNGKVYVGTSNQVDIYGLLNGASQTQSPILSPGTESYAGTATITITDATPNASIYYTTDGSTPTASSTQYTAPISISLTETINAIASAPNLLLSAVSSATYTNVTQTSTVTFSLPTGTYTAAQTVTISDSTANSVIYYTTDGSTPTSASTVYTGPLNIGTTETITAIAIAPGLHASPAIAQTYTISLGQSGISFGQGFAASTGLVVLNGSTDLDDSRLQITNGLAGQAGSAWYHTPVNIQSFTTDFTFQLSNPGANGITFAMENAPANVNALGGNSYDMGYAPLPTSMAVMFQIFNNGTASVPAGSDDATGLYLDGATPALYTAQGTLEGIDLSSSGIDLHSGDTMAVHLVYDGTTLSMSITDIVTGAVFNTSWTVNIPNAVGSNTAYVGFTGGSGALSASQKILTWSFISGSSTPSAAKPTYLPAAGTYNSAQNVIISDATTGATIYYTTDGTTPTTASHVYNTPVAVAATETINAIAVATGDANSPVAAAAYTITNNAATPTFLPAAGTYNSAQTVAISDASAGAAIYYTTNGSTPTTASNLYTAPVAVGASETINAIAVATGYSNSAVGTAAYTISLDAAATPGFSPGTGTYNSAQTVAIADTTAGAAIYYTTNGSAPTTASNLYTAPVAVGASETINAIAVATGYSNSAVGTAVYTITLPAVATPGFSIAAGTYANTQTVILSDVTPGAAIYYTVNGGAPTAASTPYTGPITVSSSETISAIAVEAGFANSPIASAAYTIGSAPPVINFAPAFTATGLNLYGATINNGALQITDGGAGETRVGWFKTKVNVQAFTTDFTFQETAPAADGFTFTIQNANAGVWAVGGTGGGLGSSGLANSVTVKFDLYNNSGEGVDSTGFYTAGAAPTVPSVDMTSSGVNLRSNDVMHAHLTYDGTTLTLTLTDTVTNAVFTTSAPLNIPALVGASTAYVGFTGTTGSQTANQNILTWTYVVGSPATLPTAATPAFSLNAGTYTGTQTVTLSDSTPGAAIYYTVNGTAPSSASTLYSAPISVAATETINAIAVETGYTNSLVGTAAYTINGATLPTAATPAFSLNAGTYTGTQTVTLSDITPGVAIYYTVNGTAPTSASTLYTAPISVAATETINAIAVETGYTNSLVGTAAYTINGATLPTAATPAFSLNAGTYTGTQTVTLSDITPGVAIYYTVNGTAPTSASSLYTAPISVAATETINAIAVETGYTNSLVGTAAYTINGATLPTAATPAFSLNAGTYSGMQTVTLSDITPGVAIYYTVNGTAPTSASSLYTAPISVAVTETINAIAIETGYTNSLVGTAAYTIGGGATPVINFPTSITSTGMNLYGATITNGALQLTDGGTSETRVAWFKTKVNVQKFTTDFTFQLLSATADGFTFTIQNANAGVWAVGSTGGGLGYGGMANSLAVKFDLHNNSGEGSDSTGFYTAGAMPAVPALDMTSSGVNLHSGDTMHAHITYDGTTLTLTLTDTVTNASYIASSPLNIPTIVNGTTAYVGFTGASGSTGAIQNIQTWTYSVNQ